MSSISSRCEISEQRKEVKGRVRMEGAYTCTLKPRQLKTSEYIDLGDTYSWGPPDLRGEVVLRGALGGVGGMPPRAEPGAPGSTGLEFRPGGWLRLLKSIRLLLLKLGFASTAKFYKEGLNMK